MIHVIAGLSAIATIALAAAGNLSAAFAFMFIVILYLATRRRT